MNTAYHIITNFCLVKDGKMVETLTANESSVAVTLKITYRSNVPFVLELGMTDNYRQCPFKVKIKDDFAEDTVFTFNMPETKDEMVESLIEIQIPKLSAENHDILFFIYNKTKSENKSIRSYDFLRLFVDFEKDISDNLLIGEYKVPFIVEEIPENMLELNARFEKGNHNKCELKYNISKTYEGEFFQPEYKEHLNKSFVFTVLAIQDSKIIEMKQSNFVWSETSLGKSGSIKLNFKTQISKPSYLTIIAIPYPFKNPEKLERYQLIAYHGISYYQHDFNIKTEIS